MRLIDADALRDTIINICGNCSNIIREYKEGVPDGNCAIQHIMNMIDNAPTVYRNFCMVKPEIPQGKWIKNLDSCNDEMQASCYCSECGASCYCATDKFCHECGADMRGKE